MVPRVLPHAGSHTLTSKLPAVSYGLSGLLAGSQPVADCPLPGLGGPGLTRACLCSVPSAQQHRDHGALAP